jgi:phosphoribosylformimino-5-aminoimidazole carboxamide ribotide isomerase
MDDVRELCKLVDDGVLGAITGRAIYEGTLDLAEAQQYCDAQR